MFGRECHSVTSVTLNTKTVWIIVTGGRRGWDIFASDSISSIKGAEVAMVVELG